MTGWHCTPSSNGSQCYVEGVPICVEFPFPAFEDVPMEQLAMMFVSSEAGVSGAGPTHFPPFLTYFFPNLT